MAERRTARRSLFMVRSATPSRVQDGGWETTRVGFQDSLFDELPPATLQILRPDLTDATLRPRRQHGPACDPLIPGAARLPIPTFRRLGARA